MRTSNRPSDTHTLKNHAAMNLNRPRIMQSYSVHSGWPRNTSRRSGNLNIVPDTLNKACPTVIKVADYLYKHTEACRLIQNTRHALMVLPGDDKCKLQGLAIWKMAE